MKKIILLIAVFALIFSFAACKGNENNSETTTAAPDTQTTAAAVETTKFSEVAGKTIMLKKNDSLDFVEIITNSENIGTTVMIYKFFPTQEEFEAEKAKGDYGTYTFINAIDVNRQIIYSDSETVRGMAYDDILAKAQTAEGYTIIPAE